MDGSETRDLQSYFVHDCRAGRGSGHLVSGAADFHEAAVVFAETWPTAGQEGEMSVIVKACDSGEEQCFVVHLDDGEAEPC